MGFFNKLHPSRERGDTGIEIEPTRSQVPMSTAIGEKAVGNDVPEVQNDWLKVPEEAVPAGDAQHGIQKIEAVTLTWSKKSLAALLIKYVRRYKTLYLLWLTEI
jgi:hypothetical protein